MNKGKKVAIILSGCGVLDGSEILESTALFFALHKNHITFECYAPNKNSAQSINYLTKEKTHETRNVLVESARLARGRIKPLNELNVQNYSGLVLPGGQGAATNLCTFASDGDKMNVDKEVEQAIIGFYNSGKPIAACCIAPIILAKLIKGVTITLGKKHEKNSMSGPIATAEKLGAISESMDIGQICFDKKNKILTTPAFMKNTDNWYEVYQGNEKLIDELAKII